LRDLLIEDDEIVVDWHEGDVERVGCAFMDRGAARTVPMIDPQNAALLWLAASAASDTASNDKTAAASACTLRMFPSINISASSWTDCQGRYHDGVLRQQARPHPHW